MMFRKSVAAFAAVIVLASTLGLAGALTARLDREKLDQDVRKILADHGGPIRAGLWIGGPVGEALYASGPTAILPTASAIKTAFLIELFARHAGTLDDSPPGLDLILQDDHPAVAHFTPAQRDEIREGLKGASVRRIGGVMMGSVPASNIVYNAAANVATALLGGPEGLTQAIHDRDPAFAPIMVRRYMLADRRAKGDNEATPTALAAVLQRLAARKVPGLDAATVEAIRRAVLAQDEPNLGRHFWKNGDLASDPITQVESGWYETEDRTIVYTVMVAQPDAGSQPRDEAHHHLGETAKRLTDTLVHSARDEATR
ncbi:serine hydrolase [Singulisphaera acidiphila]|uniref:Beta-lactamase class A n=1 Tax=Singulisphaera acidiphila (strain ATCC BAA-1392 / DSM 18658 / VKM B-2454 / MOB10) TaxID=886293 RepID=L0DQH4_SINAD|nr:hypothetical protein [Singulisphaera acidiphila]AGA31178.1 hypothetical protein Sinac_7124 [Singulisphaera acidiphila DSM 18658]